MNRIPLLLAGLPGRMALEVANVALEEPHASRVMLLDVAMTGPGVAEEWIEVADQPVRLIKPAERAILQTPPGTISIDFTQPDAALDNIDFFVGRGLPFVMGTTGFAREEAVERVRAANLCAVIAPNMAIPIVLIQTAMNYMAAEFPGSMDGYQFGVMESHQKGKKDTSGTAKALVTDFAKLGLPAKVDQIKMIRDPSVQQREFSVPPEHLNGHAYHFYEMATTEGDVRIELSHRIHGRRVYAQGALAAAEFLARKVAGGAKGQVYSMTDVMRGL